MAVLVVKDCIFGDDQHIVFLLKDNFSISAHVGSELATGITNGDAYFKGCNIILFYAERRNLGHPASKFLVLEGFDYDPGRLAQEVAYLADRSDVSEEMVRLQSHLTQFREALDASAETGKMLDFLLQELNREANTTLSKSTDLAIKEAALNIKAEVEKLREQIQNVE